MLCIFDAIFEFGEEVKSCKTDNYSNISILCQIFNFCQHIALSYEYLYVASVFDFNNATVIVELLALLYMFININILCKRKDTKATCGLILRQLAGFRLEVVKTTSAGHARNLASTVDISTCPDGKFTVL